MNATTRDAVYFEELRLREIRKRRKAELFRALHERVLTVEELIEVGKYGASINIIDGVPYHAPEKASELSLAMQIQTNLRMARDANQPGESRISRDGEIR